MSITEESVAATEQEKDLTALNDAEQAYVQRLLTLKEQVDESSDGELEVGPGVLAQVDTLVFQFREDLVYMAVRHAHTHPNDKLILRDDLHQAHRMLVRGGAEPSKLINTFTTIGGLALGFGLPTLIGPLLTGAATSVSPLTLTVGGLSSAVGVALLALGLVGPTFRDIKLPKLPRRTN